MGLSFAYCPFRLRFKHPFGTAHGLRDGTDSLFLRIEQDGCMGYGEITLPPYVKETIPETLKRIHALAARGPWDAEQLLERIDSIGLFTNAPACRAGVQMALVDLIGKRTEKPAFQVLNVISKERPRVLMTLGISKPSEVPAKLKELPATGNLKLKVGDSASDQRIQYITNATSSDILIDGNQGLNGLEEAFRLAHLVGGERLLGIEQPFAVGLECLSHELAQRIGAVVIADESLQDEADLDRIAGFFGGINIKLMKCGGLDVALSMIKQARARDLKVMLGSMSESSLGCTAMAHLAGLADLIDLDGPWLIANDPFKGIGIEQGRLVLPQGLGLGAEPIESIRYIDA